MNKQIEQFIKHIKPYTQPVGNPITCQVCNHEYKIPDEYRERWEELNYPCPACLETYSNRNSGERILFRLQDNYFATDDLSLRKELLGQIYVEIGKYSIALLRKYPKVSKQLYQRVITDQEFCEEKAYEAANYIINHFLKRDDFSIGSSWSGYITTAALPDALFHRKSRDILGSNKNQNKHDIIQEVVSTDVMFESERGESGTPVFQIYEIDGKLHQIEKKEHREDLVNQLIQLVMVGTDKYVDGEKEKLASRVALLNFFEKKGDPSFANKYFKIYGRDGKDLFEEILKVIGKELIKEDIFKDAPQKLNNNQTFRHNDYQDEFEFTGTYDKNDVKIHLNTKLKVDGLESLQEVIKVEKERLVSYGYMYEGKFNWLDNTKIEVVS